MEKVNMNFKMVVALLVFRKELVLLPKNVRASDKVRVGGDGTDSRGSHPSLSHTTRRLGLSRMVICRTYVRVLIPGERRSEKY